MAKLTLSEILKISGVEDLSRVVMINHTVTRPEVRTALASDDFLRFYTATQAKTAFKGKELLLVFFGDTKKTVFRQAYTITGEQLEDYESLVPADYHESYSKMKAEHIIYHELNGKTSIAKNLGQYRDRLCVTWPVQGRTSWKIDGRYAAEMPVTAILPEISVFPGIDSQFDYHTLSRVFAFDDDGNPWRSALSSMQGVYLITIDGTPYIGSATGKDGIWGRWKEYVAGNHHGDNKKLKELLEKDANAYLRYRFYVLEIAKKTNDSKEVIGLENKWKEILGSRVMGLNKN